MKSFISLALALLLAGTAQPSIAATAPRDDALALANKQAIGGIGYREGWVGEGDTRIHYVEAGEGPLLLFVHGFPSFWFSWFDQMEALKGRYHVVAIDALGAGGSSKPADLAPYRVAALARQLDDVARKVGKGSPFILVGHDWGAALALAYAEAYPERLHGVVGMSAPPFNLFLDMLASDAEQQRRSSYMQRFRAMSRQELAASGFAERFAGGAYKALGDSGALSAEEMALFQRRVGNIDAVDGGLNWYRANIPALEEAGSAAHWPDPRRALVAPTLMIWGKTDQTFNPDFLERMRKGARDITVVELDDVGHWTPMERPAEVNAALEAFADRVTANSD